MKFCKLAEIFFQISKESSRLNITYKLKDLYQNLTPEESQIVTYLALGSLGPDYKSNYQFNFAQKNLEKIIAQIFNQDLSEFKKSEKKAGDLSLVITSDNWPYQDANLDIIEVYNSLLELQSITGTGAQEEKANLLSNLFKKLDGLSASFIIRIILSTMRLGFSDMTIIDSLSFYLAGDKSLRSEIESKYNICADLGLIAYQIKLHGQEGLKLINAQVSIPIRPAAAERASSCLEIIDRMGDCIAQPKLDGFRLQIHIDNSHLANPQIWFYSRNLQNMTGMFPDLSQALIDKFHLHDLSNPLKIKNMIIEGEAIVYDELSESFLPFQETVKRKRKHGIDQAAQELPLRLFIFDILYFNDKLVLEKSYQERRAILLSIISDKIDLNSQERIFLIEEEYCKTAQELNDYFNKNITQGLEGLVVKRPNTDYKPGKRNFNWIKLKRHQEGNLQDTIDAVVLGYYKGRGKRAAFEIGAFLVGVYNKETDRFETTAKIGTGLKDNEWRELKEKCDKIKVDHKPFNLDCNQELEPDVWVNPEIVVIVLADEITQSPMHTASKSDNSPGLALRFPRFIGYALDKNAQQATTSQELRRLYDLQFD